MTDNHIEVAAARQQPSQDAEASAALERAQTLLGRMTSAEKIGQLHQVNGGYSELEQQIRDGNVGSVINEVRMDTLNELQRIACEESRLGIPLLIGRDVIHGFRTIFPIPLGQAAAWDTQLIETCARVAAIEAASVGVNWTFAPMLDVSRDPRWGRIAESLSEDPYLCSHLGAAMVRGFQGDDLSQPGAIAACAKHFAGYGAVEGGIDYNTTNIPEIELRSTYLPSFKAALDAGAVTVMASFTDLNGVPATANEFLMQQVLRKEWGFGGFVVSDWDSIVQLSVHGLTANDAESALAAFDSGINMDMNSGVYSRNLGAALAAGAISETQLDAMVEPILATKFRLGLFENAYCDPASFPAAVNHDHRELAKQAAMKSCVLLKNANNTLPLLRETITSLAVIGPLADDGYEQLGTWVFDGDAADSITALAALQTALAPAITIHSARGVENTRSHNTDGFDAAIEAARQADSVVMFVGEEAILSGEAHCRADINLPGAQVQLIEAISELGKPLTLVIMAGRPLTLSNVIDKVDAILYAWHPGTMAGPAIADLLFGVSAPSAKLPVTFPRVVGQIPIYYGHKNTGKPPSHDTITSMEAIDNRAPQTSLGMSAFYLDAGFTPLFPFGFGLSYSRFEYRDLSLSAATLLPTDEIKVQVTLQNTGPCAAEEIVQLYIRDLVASVTRPVKELKGFQKHYLQSGASIRVEFSLSRSDLMFCNRHMEWVTEPGDFRVWVGGCSDTEMSADFRLEA
ncbi:beta-glucosidase BglX [Halieaceae bacterium IMCC14734]|uniref:beta-glucosidase n=1 Tax=Candidatus Litorirhabdus singularis TaxID=2518993 RepID=A0ABT3TD09_9GAMM|nr:beta-glucosidase BglX [Candidatus Litorirhabdus singularis]MCX2980169.1 beta-glucosidase BglX [Candidatus Litorirhabdus singularis]